MKLIEFVGMPRSGKTTQAELVKKEIETRGHSVVMLNDRERMSRMAVPPQESLAFALALYGQLLDAYYRYRDSADYMLIDRGWSDAAVWADVYRAMKVVTDEEADALAACFDRFAKLPTAVVQMDVPVDVALARHRETLHEGVDDVAMNREWLEAIAAAYARRKSGFANPVEVDGRLTPDEAHAKIMGFLEATGSI